MTTQQDVRVRMAPSPTGMMHIGTLRTVLYDDLFAKGNDGKLILRIEDTDQSRKVDGALENLLEMLRWAGIEHDEGPVLANGHIEQKGEYGPYIQSERLDIYRTHVERLLENGSAYHCFCSSERLDEMRTAQQKAKQPPMYDRTCCALNPEEITQKITQGEKYVVRMKVPRGEEIIVDDLVRGKVVFQADTVDDQVILKSDGFPTYHLAVVVDDYLMKISHVIRGEEWLPSTPKHILLYKMFGWDVPQFAHLPLLLNPDKSKLSKRQGDVAVEDYVAKGYLKEAIINFVAFLGWNPGGGSTEEIFSREELIELFQMEKVHKAGAVVNIDKLNWMNAQYIKKMSVQDLYAATQPFFIEKTYYKEMNRADKDLLMRRVVEVEQERLERLDSIGEDNPFFFGEISVEKEMLRWKENSDEETHNALLKARDVMTKIEQDDWSRGYLQEALMEAAGEKRGDFLWPLRAALTGEKRSPSPMDCAWVLGKEETLQRLSYAITLFEG